MAALPTGTKLFHTVMGNMQVGAYTFTGNASGTTFSAPVQTVLAAWLNPRVGLAGTTHSLTYSGNTITIVDTASAAAIASGATFDIVYIGV